MTSSYRDPIDQGGLAPLPPARRRSGARRTQAPWLKYALAAAVPVAVVVLLLGHAVGGSNPGAANTGGANTGGSTMGGGGQQQANMAGAAGSASAGMDATPGDAGGAADPSAAPPASAAATAGGYEAEDATLGPTTKRKAVAGASGGTVVTNVGHGTPGGDVTFKAVTVKAAGAYTLTVHYVLADTVAHRLALWVNGKGPTILSFNPSGANTVGALKTTVTLPAGTSTMRFSNATQKYGPDLDRITLTPQ